MLAVKQFACSAALELLMIKILQRAKIVQSVNFNHRTVILLAQTARLVDFRIFPAQQIVNFARLAVLRAPLVNHCALYVSLRNLVLPKDCLSVSFVQQANTVISLQLFLVSLAQLDLPSIRLVKLSAFLARSVSLSLRRHNVHAIFAYQGNIPQFSVQALVWTAVRDFSRIFPALLLVRDVQSVNIRIILDIHFVSRVELERMQSLMEQFFVRSVNQENIPIKMAQLIALNAVRAFILLRVYQPACPALAVLSHQFQGCLPALAALRELFRILPIALLAFSVQLAQRLQLSVLQPVFLARSVDFQFLLVHRFAYFAVPVHFLITLAPRSAFPAQPPPLSHLTVRAAAVLARLENSLISPDCRIV